MAAPPERRTACRPVSRKEGNRRFDGRACPPRSNLRYLPPGAGSCGSPLYRHRPGGWHYEYPRRAGQGGGNSPRTLGGIRPTTGGFHRRIGESPRTPGTRYRDPGKLPEFGSDEYEKWVGQDDFVQFLKTVPDLDEMILYAMAEHVFLYGVLVPTRLISPPDIHDLAARCNLSPSSGWSIVISKEGVSPAPPLDHTGSKTLDQGEQIVFDRSFDGRQEQPSYIEILQKLTHLFDLHYVPEREAYCRFDDHGDVEDVIRIGKIPFDDLAGLGSGRIVTIKRDILDEYMTLTGQSLILLFDSTRFDSKKFVVWANSPKDYEQDPEIWYYIECLDSYASYLRGFQIIRSMLSQKDPLGRHGFGQSNDRQYATFIAHDWKHETVRECSCDPEQLGNYFVESDLPFETSPVFFRPEVLSKYKANSDKYEIQARSIACRNAWHLEIYDVNDAGQVHTYLKYLAYLPYNEQLYWKSFNEAPKAPISKRSLETDFEGNWDLQYDPLQSLIGILHELHEARIPWWKLRDETLMEKVHYPVTMSTDEWAREIHSLHKLLVEGFQEPPLRSLAASLGRNLGEKWRSIRLLREVLLGLDKDETEIKGIVQPFLDLVRLRNEFAGHSPGVKGKQIKKDILKEHKTYSAHFSQLCEKCDAAVRTLRTIFSEENLSLRPEKSSI